MTNRKTIRSPTTTSSRLISFSSASRSTVVLSGKSFVNVFMVSKREIIVRKQKGWSIEVLSDEHWPGWPSFPARKTSRTCRAPPRSEWTRSTSSVARPILASSARSKWSEIELQHLYIHFIAQWMQNECKWLLTKPRHWRSIKRRRTHEKKPKFEVKLPYEQSDQTSLRLMNLYYVTTSIFQAFSVVLHLILFQLIPIRIWTPIIRIIWSYSDLQD